MNPKEKAKDLIEKYLRLEDDTLFYWNGYYDRQMLDEDGIELDDEFFWADRQSIEWQYNWELF